MASKHGQLLHWPIVSLAICPFYQALVNCRWWTVGWPNDVWQTDVVPFFIRNGRWGGDISLLYICIAHYNFLKKACKFKFVILIQCDQIGRFLNVFGDMVSIKSSPNAWWIFGLNWKAALFMLNYCGYYFGKYWKNLGYFLIQYLVTLLAC